MAKSDKSHTARLLREVLARLPIKRASVGRGRGQAQREAAE